MPNILKENCINGLVYKQTGDIKIGQIYSCQSHKWRKHCRKKFVVSYIYKTGNTFVIQTLNQEGYCNPYINPKDFKNYKLEKTYKNLFEALKSDVFYIVENMPYSENQLDTYEDKICVKYDVRLPKNEQEFITYKESKFWDKKKDNWR